MQALPSVEAKAQLASQLKGKVLEYMLNSHGNHVIQCCIVSIPAAEDGHSIEFMLEVRLVLFVSCSATLPLQ